MEVKASRKQYQGYNIVAGAISIQVKASWNQYNNQNIFSGSLINQSFNQAGTKLAANL